MSNAEEWLTVDEVANELKVHEKTVKKWIHSEGLVAMNIGKGYRISRTNLNDFIESKETGKKRQFKTLLPPKE